MLDVDNYFNFEFAEDSRVVAATRDQLAEPILMVPSETTARIQEMHVTLGHMLCGALERSLGLV